MIMKYYINGIEVTKRQMKLQYYIEKYRLQFILIFINRLLKKYLSVIKFIVSFILWLCFLIIWVLTLGNNETNAYDWNKLLNYMNLPDCRITQDEDSHLEKGNWSMYAYDIACIRWRSFEVYAPNYKDIYVVKYIWYDSRIGNYITIKHWDLYFIYWHTQTDLKVGTALKPGDLIGRTNLSWLSENYHLHLELWEWNNNISFEYLAWKGSIINPKSLKLREQRNWLSWVEINTYIVEFIRDFEWLRLEAYWDINHWSIWMWTPSYKWERITEQEAIKRVRIKIQSIKDRYNLHNYSLDVQKAVVSFIYNIWSLNSDQIRLLENWYYKALWNDFKLYNWYYKDWKKIVLRWLQKRRNSEAELL